MVVLVLGANGQLGQALQYAIASHQPHAQFHFFKSTEVDITKKDSLEAAWSNMKPQFCINAAAYTAVDLAENEPEKAVLVNVIGVRNLVEVCMTYQTTLLHVSTDFVFDGHKNSPYTETDQPNPLSVYGTTKYEGELEITKAMRQYFIIRTSWLYSQFGNNFMKTMLKLEQERNSLNVVDDQIGTPTHAIDLAVVLLNIIESKSQQYGIYNFSNEGSVSWYDFAKKIFELKGSEINLNPIPTSQYPTPAKRPHYSVLDKTKIKTVFSIKINTWDKALEHYFHTK